MSPPLFLPSSFLWWVSREGGGMGDCRTEYGGQFFFFFSQ